MKIIFIFFCTISIPVVALAQNLDYLNLQLPGVEPQLFNTVFLYSKDGYHSPIIFTPNSEAYFSPMAQNLITKRIINNNEKWGAPKTIDFGFEEGIVDPFISPVGKRLYFLSFRPLPSDPIERGRKWFVEKVNGKWSSPILSSKKVASHPTHWTFSVALNYNLYFLSEIDGGQNIYYSQYIDNEYIKPKLLNSSINTNAREFCPFIAPDESYLIFSRVGPGTKKADLFISFNESKNNWAKAKRLNNV